MKIKHNNKNSSKSFNYILSYQLSCIKALKVKYFKNIKKI